MTMFVLQNQVRVLTSAQFHQVHQVRSFGFTGKAGSGIENQELGSRIEDQWSGIGKLKNCRTLVDRGDVGRSLWLNFTEHIPRL